MTTPKHTRPTPWITKPRTDGLVNIYHAAGVHDVALCVRPVDAELIIRAVNAFEPMREALGGALWLLEKRISQEAWLALDEGRRAEYVRVLDEIRAALALAEKEYGVKAHSGARS